MTGRELKPITGPYAWLNWYAERAGEPPRTSPNDEGSPLINFLWTEYTLHSDAALQGALVFGPFVVKESDETYGETPHAPSRATLRSADHLVDARWAPRAQKKSVVDAYVGGGQDYELAALLSLALDRRLRSRGPVLVGRAVDEPRGEPYFRITLAPALAGPGIDGPMLPGVDRPAELGAAAPFIEQYGAMSAPDAAVLVRAASQFADALWFADADPRLAWLKLVGAVETAANDWDRKRAAGGRETSLERLRRHMPDAAAALADCPDEVQAEIADQLAGLVKATAKFHDFLLAFLPPPPSLRPSDADQRVPWTREELSKPIKTIYRHRSNDVHEGIPFPAPLCEPPYHRQGSVPPERFEWEGAWAAGGYWPAEDMPMYLHTFAILVGGALRLWWSSALGRGDVDGAGPHES